MKYLTIFSALFLSTLVACGGGAADEAQKICDCMTGASGDVAKMAECGKQSAAILEKHKDDEAWLKEFAEAGAKCGK